MKKTKVCYQIITDGSRYRLIAFNKSKSPVLITGKVKANKIDLTNIYKILNKEE